MICRARSWTGLNRRGGFSLVEMVVVVALIAIIAASVTLSLKHPLKRARMQRAWASLQNADRAARSQALNRSGTVNLVLDGSKGTVAIELADVNRTINRRRSIGLDGGLVVDRIETRNRSSSDGTMTIPISATGQSDSYAVRLRGGENQLWFVVLGATGQCIKSVEDELVESLIVQR